MNRQRIFNRAIDPGWMAAALDIASDGARGDEGRSRLEIRLRDAPLADAARAKVVEAIHPIWINPPEETRALIAWAAERADGVPDMRPVHLVALMATYPFVADVAAIAGKMLRNEGTVDSGTVRARLKASWGDRDSVAVGSRKCLQTLRLFGVLSGGRGTSVSVADERFTMTGDWALWSVAAMLLARGADLVDGPTVESAAEYFFLDAQVPRRTPHSLLELVTSGDGRTTYALRHQQHASSTPSDSIWGSDSSR